MILPFPIYLDALGRLTPNDVPELFLALCFAPFVLGILYALFVDAWL